MKAPRTCLQVLLWSACISLLEQQATESQYLPVPTGQLQPLISSFIYVIQPGITMNICPVLISDTSQEFLIQPAPSGRPLHGQFLTNTSLADTQFNGTQVVQACAEIVGQLCDQLVLRVNSGSEVTPGSFRVRYVPARGGQNIEVDVLYGAPGIMYLGEFQPNVPIILDKSDTLTFKLRIRLSSRFTPPNIIVCESISGSSFQPSKMLVLSSPFPAVVTTCLHSSDNSASSRPYTVRVVLADSVKESSDFSQRRVKLVINTSCSSMDPLITSEVLTVVGLNATTVGTEPTTMETTTTLTTSTTDFISPSLRVEDIIGITVGAVLLLVVTVVVVTCCVLCCRKSSHDDGGRSTPGLCLVADGSEMHNSLNDIHIDNDHFELKPKVSKPQEDDVDEVDHSTWIRVLPFLSVESEQWIEEFENKLADIYGGQLMPTEVLNADSSPQHSSNQQLNFNSLKQDLRHEEFKLLCIIRDAPSATESPACAQLLQLLRESPEFKHKVIVTTFGAPKDEIKQLKWCLDVHYRVRGESRDTAERLRCDIEMERRKESESYQAHRKLKHHMDWSKSNSQPRPNTQPEPRPKTWAFRRKQKSNRAPELSGTQSHTQLLHEIKDTLESQTKELHRKIDSHGEEIHRQGEKIDSHGEEIHRQGERIEERLDRQGEKIDSHGEKLHQQGTRIEEQLDGQEETLGYLTKRADETALVVGQDNGGASGVFDC